MVGKAKIFSDQNRDAIYQKEVDDENYAAAAQQNSYNLGSTHFSDQSGIGNFAQAGSDQRKASVKGALFTGNIGFDLQTARLDVGTFTIDLNEDGASTVLSIISTDRIVTLSAGTTGDLVTIVGPQRPGQRLFLYGIQGNTITIKNTAAATVNTILTPNGDDVVLADTDVVQLLFDITTSKWRVVAGPGGGAGTGTYTTARMDQDQIANLAIGNHVQWNEVIEDGGIVLQGQTPTFDQTSGIFELKAGKTYYLSTFLDLDFTANTDLASIVFYDITNATEISQRMDIEPVNKSSTVTSNSAIQTIFTPVTDVTVELRIVALAGTITNIQFETSQISLFEFSGTTGAQGPPGASGSGINWKEPARAKTLIDVPNLAAFDVITDGVTLVQNDRVLLTEQVTQSENGLWQVGVVAVGLAPLTRPTDFDSDAEVVAETFVPIEEGTTSKDSLWHLISDNPLSVDVSNQVWDIFAPGTSGGPDLGAGEDGIDAAGEWVYDGRTATGNHITKRWEQGTNSPAADNGVNDILYMTSNGNIHARIFAIGDSNLTNPAAYSDDLGDTWTTSTLSGNHVYVRSAYDPVQNVLITVNSDANTTTTTKARSTDRGANFSNVTSPNTDKHNDIIWSPVDGLFVATCFSVPVGPGQIRGIQTSPDGVTWTAQVTPAGGGGFWKFVAYSTILGLYVCTQGGGTDVMTSPDAINWTLQVGSISTSTHNRLIYSEGQNKFVAVGHLQAGSSLILNSWISVDGITWEQFTVDTFADGVSDLLDVFWAPDLSLYVAVGGSTATGFNSSTHYWVSNDAEVWARISIDVDSQNSDTFQGITYSQEYGQFLVVTGTSGITLYRTFR